MSDPFDTAIAVIGLGARVPGADSAGTFFRNVLQGVYSITDVPVERWDPAIFYDPDPAAPDRTYSRIGGFLSDFSPPLRTWRIPPSVARSLDPTQILALDVTHQALADAGLLERELDRSRCAVILGNSMGGDQRDHSNSRLSFALFAHALRDAEGLRGLGAAAREALIAELGQRVLGHVQPISEDTMAGELSNVVAGRVAAAYRLTGPSYTVDAACAASLAAVSAAVRSLRARECDLALTGGVDRNMGASAYVKFCKTHALSATRSAPFDASADGFVMGEGAGVLVLKRLADAERDGDRVRAVIRGVGASSDGGGRGITAPNPDGQVEALRRAYADAGVDPQTLGLIEAHGTATPVGDAAEVETLCRILGPRAPGAEPVAVGSVKSNLGHLKSAAGAASLVKTVLALESRRLPPSVNFTEPSPALRRPDLPFRIQTRDEPWAPRDGGPRRAGVSAFGFGGTNFHVVLEEHGHLGTGRTRVTVSSPSGKTLTTPQDTTMSNVPSPVSPISVDPAPPQALRTVALPEVALLRLGAPDRDALLQALEGLSGRLAGGEPFAALAAAYGQPIHAQPLRAALVAGSIAELGERLDLLREYLVTGKGGLRLAGAGIHVGQGPASRTAFLFPGQGSQYVGMLGDLRDALPEVSAAYAEADGVMADLLDRPLSAFILGAEGASLAGAPGAGVDAAARALQQTTVTQPAMLAADLALLRVLDALGVRPDEVAGHSLGEYAAAVAAGVIPFHHALRVVAARGREMSGAVPAGADPGKMAVLAAPADAVARLLETVPGYVVAANKNSPGQTVIAGESPAVEAALARAAEQGLQGMLIPVSHAFHSRMVAAASEPLRALLARSGVTPPRLPIYSNVTAERYPAEAPAIIDLLARQVASPVEFTAIVERMYASGVRTFVEVGPKHALAGFVRDILGHRPHRAIHTNHPKKGGPRSLAEAVALLVADGQPVGPTCMWTPAAAPVRIATAAPAPAAEAIWITGASAGVPGRARLFDDEGLDALLRGETLLGRIEPHLKQAIVDQRIERLVKSADGTGTLEPVSGPEAVMTWAGRAGALPLVEDYRVSAEWDQDRDPTTRMALAAAHEALRDAWLPLVEQRRAVSGGRTLSAGFRLPEPVGQETGVIFASAFPGYAKLLELVEARAAGAPFARNTLLQILGLGHAHVAERLGALGPNLHVNAACASTPAALALASDWIHAGRCRRVLVVAADDVTSDALLPWIGGGFLALGAATTAPELEQAALPFGRTRHGMILGMGAVGLVVESAAAARERGVTPLCEVVATRLANSADHPMRLRPAHIAAEMDAFVAEVTGRLGLTREALARDLVFVSHETFTPARGGSAQAEVDALRRAFGDQVGEVLVVNTKGYTGHPMAVGLEDAAAVAGLWRRRLPAVANLTDPDPDFADLAFHRGGPVDRRHALRFAAGFGSQVAMVLYRRGEGDPLQPRVDEPVFRAHLREACGGADPSVVLDARLLRLRSPGSAADAGLPDALAAAFDRKGAVATEVPAAAAPAVETALPAAATPALTEADILGRLQDVVAARTGYDRRELEPDLELEADLGIDTVKQAEIVAELRDHYGLERDGAFRLADHPTLQALARYVAGRLPAQTDAAPAPAPAPAIARAPVAATVPVVTDLGGGFAITRVGYQAAEVRTCGPLTPGGPVLVVGGSASEAEALVAELGQGPAVHLALEELRCTDETRVLDRLARTLPDQALAGALWRIPAATDADAQVLGTAFFWLARALAVRAPRPGDPAAAWPLSWLLTVVESGTAPGDRSGLASHCHPLAGAVAGLTRALGREWPGCRVRVLATAEAVPVDRLGTWLREELTDDGQAREVRRSGAGREVLALGGDLAASPLPLGQEDVVLITGATGGIGALAARGLRQRLGCRLVLTGRLDRPGQRVDTPPDRAEVKAALEARGQRPTPAAVSAAVDRWHREQALEALLRELEATGPVLYHRADLGDPESVASLVSGIAGTFGRLDAVIHAAGIQRSKALEGKRTADYVDTFACKAGGAARLWQEITRRLATPPRRFLGLGSVAGLLGNAGQADYASANAALAGLTTALGAAGTAGLTIHFTGWDDLGMTTDTDLRARLEERGLALLPPALGLEALLRLLTTDLGGEVLVAGALGGLAGGLELLRAAPATGPLPPLRLPLHADLPWLRDHAIDGTPVLPAVVGLEWMARAATAGRPGHRVVAVEEARFLRPLKVHPDRPVVAVVELEPTGYPDRVRATVRSERVNRAGTAVDQEHFSAELRLAPADAALPDGRDLAPLHLGTLDRLGPEAEEIYGQLFHTGIFRVLRAARLLGDEGLVAEAAAPFFSPGAADRTDLAPLAVEAALQAAGLHALIGHDTAVLPAGITALTLHAEAADIARAGAWILRVRALGIDPAGQVPRHARFDVDVLDDHGAPLVTLRNLQLVERAPTDPARRPATPRALEIVEIDVGGLGQPDARVLDLDAELAPAEQRRARAIPHAGRRLEWIAGRLAAKELVRRHLRDRYGLVVPRGRIEIATDPGGAPVAWVPARPGLAALLPAISITHACGQAIALGLPAADPGVRVGVDLTGVEARPDSFAAQWLTDGEQRLLAEVPAGSERNHRLAALWSLKEAVSKALGLGLQLTSGELEIVALDAQGYAETELHGAAAERYADLGGRRLRAATQPWPGGVLAWACLELGDDDDRSATLAPRPLLGLREARLTPTT
jgi:phosphopantetheine--protein transferase-like protein